MQRKLRTAARARDYHAIDACYALGTTAANALLAVLPDILRSNDCVLFEILLCSAPDGIDIDGAIEIAKAVCAEHRVASMYLHWAFLKKLTIDEHIPKLKSPPPAAR